MTEEEMVGWHHRLNGREFEQALGDAGQGSLVRCSQWGRKESDTTEGLNNNAGDAKDTGSIPASGRSSGAGNDNLLQLSCLE